MSEYRPHWGEIARFLREARGWLPRGSSVPDPATVPVGLLTGTLDGVEEFLGHNELELAWDALATVAGSVKPPTACWRALARAARLMDLADKEAAALRQARPKVASDQALAIARLDAEKVYPELFDFRIVMALEPDGWHVDYELVDPDLNGGGPHYVIDADTGSILTKTYEQ